MSLLPQEGVDNINDSLCVSPLSLTLTLTIPAAFETVKGRPFLLTIWLRFWTFHYYEGVIL